MSKWFTAKHALRGNPGLRALNAHMLAACPPGELEQLKGELAAREERSEQAAAAVASGGELEGWLDEQHELAAVLGLADMEHTHPPVVVKEQLGGGEFLGKWKAKGGPDYRGVLKGGTAIAVEAKNAGRHRLGLVDTGKPRFDGVKRHQAAALNRCLKLGGVALLVVRFRRRVDCRDVDTTYCVPWDEVCGLESIGPDDVASWAVRGRLYLERWVR